MKKCHEDTKAQSFTKEGDTSAKKIICNIVRVILNSRLN
jgi:hypothetical protein